MINQQRLVNLFCEIVKIDSPTGKEFQMAKFLKRWIKQNLNISASIDSYYNVFAKYKGKKNKSLLLNAHTDTVQPCLGIQPKIHGNKITSSGNTILGADNKAAIAAILEAILTIKENNINSPNIEILFTSQEEEKNIGAINFDYNQINSSNGFCFDCAQPLGTILIASPYYIRFDVKIFGKNAHASKPEQGIHVIKYLAQKLSKINLGNYNDCLVNIGIIHGGTARNTIMGELKLSGEIRSYYKDKIYETLEYVQNIFQDYKEFKTEFSYLKENDGYIIENNDPLIKYASKIIQKNNLSVKKIFDGGCSDANIIRSKKINLLNLADGIFHPHTTREYVEITNLNKLSNLIKDLITDY